MNKDEILASLDLEAGVAPVKGSVTAAAPATAIPVKPTGSPTVLDLDKWDVARGAELLAASPELRKVNLPDAANAVADLHALAFKPYPELADAPQDKVRAAFVQELLNSGDCKALRVSTVLNSIAADIAAVTFAKSYAEFVAKLPKQPEKGEGEPSEGEGEGESGESGDDGEDAADQSGDESGPSEEVTDAAESAARGAVRAATKEVEEMEEAAAAFGYGAGGEVKPCDVKAIGNLYKTIRDNPTLRRIVDLAGRFRRVAQAKQKSKIRRGADEMVGITLGDRVDRLLSHELARLTDPELEYDILRRIVDREAMVREIRGNEKVGRGPIIVCVDESSSMTGCIASAKAFALAMAWIARHQRRWCALVAYTGTVYGHRGSHRVLPRCPHTDDTPGVRTLVLPPGKRDDAALMGWLTEFMGYGSAIDVPLREMRDIYTGLKAPQGKTDIFFVSDCIVNVPKVVVDQFNIWKKEASARLITLRIGGGSGGASDGFSDELYNVDGVNPENMAIHRCFGV